MARCASGFANNLELSPLLVVRASNLIVPIVVEVCAPTQVSARRRELFMRLVRQGGEVDAHSLPRLVDRALALGFAFRADDLVAVGGVKRPNAGHRARVFASAGVAMDPGKFEFELGWVYVIPDARDQHVSTRLVEALMQNIGEAQVYATSRVNNERMHALFARLEFAPVGEPYPSKLNEPNIQLFVRERHTHGADDNEPGADG